MIEILALAAGHIPAARSIISIMIALIKEHPGSL